MAELSDGLVGGHEAVEGVDAGLWCDGGVGCLAAVSDVAAFDAVHGRSFEVEGRGVDHHGDVDAFECTALEHELLAADVLFGGGTEHEEGDGVGGDGGLEADGACHAAGGDEVVAAGVADLGEGVVLAEVGDGDGAFAPAGGEGGLEAESAALDGEAACFESVGEEPGSAGLLEGELGVAVDVEADLGELGARVFDGVDRLLLGCVHSCLLLDCEGVWGRADAARHVQRSGREEELVDIVLGAVGC